MDRLIGEYIKEMKLSSGLDRQLVFNAWDMVSGAAPLTLSKYVKAGVLYCTISSSAVRQQLFFRRRELVEKINAFLEEDPLFQGSGNGGYLKDIVLR